MLLKLMDRVLKNKIACKHNMSNQIFGLKLFSDVLFIEKHVNAKRTCGAEEKKQW